MEMGASRFSSSVMEPTFDPACLKTARKDIKQTSLRASYKGHTE